MNEATVKYDPQPKQLQLHESPANEILFGGAAGPGKSHALRFEALSWCLKIPGLQVYLFRRTFPELFDNHILKSWLEFPPQAGHYNSQDKCFYFNNKSILHYAHCQHEKDVFRYQGAEIHILLIDELTTFTKFIFDYLVGRVRCTLDIPPQFKHKVPGILCASNPGNIGHTWVKERWVDYAEPYKLKRAPIDFEHPEAPPMVRQYIPGLLADNPILAKTDPGYITRLNNLPEPWRTAYKTGDWEIFMGQMFQFSKQHHVCYPRPVPESAPLYYTLDWGFGAPYSMGWWWFDADNRAYRFREFYGQLKGAPENTGTRETDSVLAGHINRIEEEEGVRGRVRHILSPDCFSKKPDYQGGGQGKSTAEVFQNCGVTQIVRGDPSRILKIRQFHERLRIPEDGTKPMIQVYDTCRDFVRTIPALTHDANNVEDVDTKLEDHAYDEAALMFMARPLSLDAGAVEAEAIKKAREEKEKDLEQASQAAWKEKRALEHDLKGEDEEWESLFANNEQPELQI